MKNLIAMVFVLIGSLSAFGQVAPAAPSNLTAFKQYDAEHQMFLACLDWIDNSSNEIGFEIQRCPAKGITNRKISWGRWATITAVPCDSEGWDDGTLIPGVVYKYRIRAFNQYGESAWSAEFILP